MSRKKSERTLRLEAERTARREERERRREEKERDKKIRAERRALKLQEKETERQERERRKAIRESLERNGVPKIRPEESQFGLREAMGFSPLVDCERCHAIVRELCGTLCERCHYSMEVNDETKDELKAEENRAVPGKGDGGETGTTALAGQLSLLI
jgi:hypothetical protein